MSEPFCTCAVAAIFRSDAISSVINAIVCLLVIFLSSYAV
jgi:hypothetical protein